MRALIVICISVLYQFTGRSAGQTPPVPPVPPIALSAIKAGSLSIVELSGAETLRMRFCPPLTCATGKDDKGRSSSEAFWIAENELTYSEWTAVYDWAVSGDRGDNRYVFSGSAGRGGYLEKKDFFPYREGHERHPASMISWRDAVVWCNAMTEFYNKKNPLKKIEPVYYTSADYSQPIRSSADKEFEHQENRRSGSADNPFVKKSAKGFRLPYADEWECAARYIGDKDGNGDILGAGESYSGVSASGDESGGTLTDEGKNSANAGKYIWFFANSKHSTHEVRQKLPNALSLYDMCGNVWEWCFNRYGDLRVIRGGSWFDTASFIQIGHIGSSAPYYKYDSIGMRVVRSE